MMFKHSWEYEQARRKKRINDFFVVIGILVSSGFAIFGLIHLFIAFFAFKG